MAASDPITAIANAVTETVSMTAGIIRGRNPNRPPVTDIWRQGDCNKQPDRTLLYLSIAVLIIAITFILINLYKHGLV